MRFRLVLVAAALGLMAACGVFEADDALAPTEPPATTDAGDDAGDDVASRPDPDAGDAAPPACTRECGGAACVGGATCASIPVLTNVDHPFGLAADDAAVFVSSHTAPGGITRAPADGAAPDPAFVRVDLPNDLVVLSGRLWYAAESSKKVAAADSTTGDAGGSITGAVAPLHMAADDLGVAWVTMNSVAWASSAFVDEGGTSFPDAPRTTAMIVDGTSTWIVAAATNGTFALWQYGRSSGATIVAAVNLEVTEATGLDHAKTNAYVATNKGILRVSDASEVALLVDKAKLGDVVPRDVVVDVSMFVVTASGDVWQMKSDGTSVTRLARSPGCDGRRLAVTADWVYWTCGNGPGGSVQKTPRPL